MSTHVLLNLLNELGKEINGEFNKFNNTGARMLDSIYHMTFKWLNNSILALNCQDLATYVQMLKWTLLCNVTKSVNRFYLMALYHSQTRRHVIKHKF